MLVIEKEKKERRNNIVIKSTDMKNMAMKD